MAFAIGTFNDEVFTNDVDYSLGVEQSVAMLRCKEVDSRINAETFNLKEAGIRDTENRPVQFCFIDITVKAAASQWCFIAPESYRAYASRYGFRLPSIIEAAQGLKDYPVAPLRTRLRGLPLLIVDLSNEKNYLVVLSLDKAGHLGLKLTHYTAVDPNKHRILIAR